jgi:UDPglucose--hexose-1-phosphate uridylyltransferase
MVKYFSNSNKTRWLVSNPDRLNRTGMDGKPFRCPFCPGNEGDTPPEVHRFGVGVADGPGWQVRVVPNKFNITDIHEVIIHSPDHEKSINELPLSQVELIIKAYKERLNVLKDKGKVYIFSNHSFASGASLIHPHSQLSVIPPDVKTNTLEVQPVVNIVEQNENFVSYCPEFSEWAYEVWIKPISNFQFSISNELQISDFAKILQSSLIKLKKIHGIHYPKKPYGYNFYISPGPDWYLRIIPRFMERAGFELSTRIMVNSVDPKMAADELNTI